MNLKLRVIAFFFVSTGLGVVPSSQSAAQDEVPDLRGEWTIVPGEGAGVHFGARNHIGGKDAAPTIYEQGAFQATVSITKQEGRSVVGTLVSPGATENIFGAIRRDNKTVLMVDEDSHVVFTLIDRDTAEICWSETNIYSMGAWCHLFERES